MQTLGCKGHMGVKKVISSDFDDINVKFGGSIQKQEPAEKKLIKVMFKPNFGIFYCIDYMNVFFKFYI